MRKLIALLVTIIMLFSCSALAEDYSSMTDDDLHSMLNSIRNELLKRDLVYNEKIVLFDQDDVQVYLTGDCDFRLPYTKLYAVVINNSTNPVRFAFANDYKISVNGWEVWGDPDYLGTTSPGKKQKGYINIKMEDAEVASFEEIEEIELNFVLMNAETRKPISSAPTVVVQFNQKQ